MFVLNNKTESIEILSEYFQKINIRELGYYLDIKQSNNNFQTIPQFLESNIFEPDQMELTNLLQEHLEFVVKNIFDTPTSLNNLYQPIGISFITGTIGWYDMFSLKNNIFICYSYLIRVFDDLETNSYKSVEQVVIDGDKIYDKGLVEKLSNCICYILQYQNLDIWTEYVGKKFNCAFVDINTIHFTFKYTILNEPNTYFLDGRIPVYCVGPNRFVCAINTIESTVSFSPYYNTLVIQLEYSDGEYKQVGIIGDTGFNIGLDEPLFCCEPNPFDFEAKLITEKILSGYAYF